MKSPNQDAETSQRTPDEGLSNPNFVGTLYKNNTFESELANKDLHQVIPTDTGKSSHTLRRQVSHPSMKDVKSDQGIKPL